MGGLSRDDDATGAPDEFEPPAADAEQAAAIQAFWEVARLHTRLGRLPVYLGEDWPDVVPPPAWAFGDSPELADELLALVLAGTKTGTATLASDFERHGEPIPAKGDLSIVLDGAGRPAALIRITSVEVVPFSAVTAEHAHSEGEGDRTLADWRRIHEAYWRRTTPEGVVTDVSPVVCERFELLYPTGSRTAGSSDSATIRPT